jgi:hypothetical protein
VVAVVVVVGPKETEAAVKARAAASKATAVAGRAEAATATAVVVTVVVATVVRAETALEGRVVDRGSTNSTQTASRCRNRCH